MAARRPATALDEDHGAHQRDRPLRTCHVCDLMKNHEMWLAHAGDAVAKAASVGVMIVLTQLCWLLVDAQNHDGCHQPRRGVSLLVI